ncbi:hypothetical protein [Gracilimonas halophila]|uniref:CpXC protein n=1 Tax=Gracilimonas halophila TaxID=1834464 RepID=A0ABW5JHP9_9BACT
MEVVLGKIICSGTVNLKCNECDATIKQDAALLNWEVEDSERGEMDTRLWHGSEELTLACPECNNDIGIRFTLIEYPEGVQEGELSSEVNGGELIGELDYQIIVEEPPENKEQKFS